MRAAYDFAMSTFAAALILIGQALGMTIEGE